MTVEMHEHLDDLRDTAKAVVAPHLATDSRPDSTLDRGLWDELEKLGFVGLGAPESVGGSDGDLLDSTTVLAELTTARLPYGEATVVAAPALGEAGIDLPSGPFTACTADITAESGHLSGLASRVPFARDCQSAVLLVVGDRPTLHVVALDAPGVTLIHGVNLAGEPRDSVMLSEVAPVASAEVPELAAAAWRLRSTLARAVAAAGVASAIVDITSRYVTERVQFGRPLVKFQVVQHAIAKMAAEATAMQVAATAAAMALLEDPSTAELLVAAAKAETAILTRPVTAAAHQAHGAIGFTQEHALGALTTRLWAWREEHGNERYWHQRLGELGCGQDLWQLVAGQQ
ncbi:acyl-CoA dehydrogenase family protein [Micromonospora sp. NPDC005206]|uniref:acyl-CoA dehydrogenase family protein n=1 Tax=Micromonospora sp. NPDC005206 TaxID=3157022 RepID=UPI0033BE02B9